MSVTVKIPSPLRTLTAGAATVDCAPGTVRELIDQLDVSYPGLRDRLCQDGELRRFVNVFVAGEDVRFADGIGTVTSDGQEVTILPAVAGG
jgi:molybdopterin synthase sulfur carrier subunit